MHLLKELYMMKESRYGYTDEQLSKGLKKYGLKRYKNIVGKGIGGYVYFHKNYIKEFPWSENIFNKMHYLPHDFQWNVIKYNEKTGSVTFINSPDFDISDEPKSMDNYTVDNENQLKYYKPPSSPTIWHHKWEWVKDDYNGFDVRDSKERSLYWNEQLEGHPDPKIKSRIGSAKVWDELSFNKINESYDINLRHNIPNDLKKSLRQDAEVGPYVKNLNAYDAIYLGNEPIGTIRIDVNSENGDIKVGSVFIMPQYRGQGYAKKAIEMAIKDNPAYTIIAPYNTSSKALFKKLGFSYDKTIKYANEPLEIWTRD